MRGKSMLIPNDYNAAVLYPSRRFTALLTYSLFCICATDQELGLLREEMPTSALVIILDNDATIIRFKSRSTERFLRQTVLDH